MNTVSIRVPTNAKCANKCLGQVSIVRHNPARRARAPLSATHAIHKHALENPNQISFYKPRDFTQRRRLWTFRLTTQQLRLGHPHRCRRRRLRLRQTQHQRRPRRKSRSRPSKACTNISTRARHTRQHLTLLSQRLTDCAITQCKRYIATTISSRRWLWNRGESRIRRWSR